MLDPSTTTTTVARRRQYKLGCASSYLCGTCGYRSHGMWPFVTQRMLYGNRVFYPRNRIWLGKAKRIGDKGYAFVYVLPHFTKAFVHVLPQFMKKSGRKRRENMKTSLTYMDYLRVERTNESWQGLLVDYCEYGRASLTSVKGGGGGNFLTNKGTTNTTIQGCWGMIPCRLVNPPRRFKEMLVHTTRVTRRHIPEELWKYGD